MPPALPSRSQPGLELDLHALWHIFRERLWLIASCAALALALAAIYLIRTPKTYVAFATVEVERLPQNVVDIKAIDGGGMDSVEAVKTIETKLNSGALMTRMLHDPELALTPERLGFPPGKNYPETMLAGRIKESISVAIVRGTRLIGITASHTDPALAAALANGVVRAYLQQLADERGQTANEASTFLSGEAERLKKKLEQSERALQAYKENTQSVSLDASQNIVVTRLQELNAKMTEAKTDRMKLEAAVKQVGDLQDRTPDQLLSITSVAASPDVIELRKRLAEAGAEVANLNEQYLEKHPKLIQAKSQYEQVRSDLERAVRKAAEAVQVQHETAQRTEDNFAAALAEQEKKALELNSTAIDYKVLDRQVESDRLVFESVFKRLQETDVTRGLNQSLVHLVEPAVEPTKAGKPRPKLILFGALVVGALLGGVLTLLRQAFDSTLRTVDQTERALGAPVLAAVPLGKRERGSKPLVEAGEGLLAESFRTLRTALSLLGDSRRSLLFTSATENDGKTFCALNYAAALARTGSRVLLIDADLRKPAIGDALFPGDAGPGLTDVLQARQPLAKVVRETAAVPNLFVLTAGPLIDHPAELLHGGAFASLLREATAQYDCVVVDTAPLQAVSDTLLLVKQVQAVCFVLRAGRTNRRAAAKSCHQLAEAGAPPIGIVLNRIPVNSRGFHYHYQAGKYGRDVYGEAEKKRARLTPGPALAAAQNGHSPSVPPPSRSPEKAG